MEPNGLLPVIEPPRMPWSPPSICAHGGCQALTVSGARYCAAHVLTAHSARLASQRDYNARRGTPASRGYNTNWRRSSRLYLAQNPVCNACGRLAECVDHRTPCDGSSPLFWDVTNWQSLCRRCHSTKTAREDGGFGNPTKRGDL